jgi:hypothetical protein
MTSQIDCLELISCDRCDPLTAHIRVSSAAGDEGLRRRHAQRELGEVGVALQLQVWH